MQNYNFQQSQSGQQRFASKMPLIKLTDVTKTYGNLKALKSINLQVMKGEILFLTGPSGAGKTTLLNILAGEILPTEGKVHHHENDSFVAEIFQDLKLFDKKSCLQNIDMIFDPIIYKSRIDFNNDRDELIKYFGIEDRLDLKISQANGGLKQKVAIIRALLTKPQVLLADEPTSSLDFENAKKLFDVLYLYCRKFKMTIVWATHNKELVKGFTGRMVHLDRGKLIYSGHACFI